MHNENHYGGLGHPVTLEDVEERQQQFTGGERVDYVPDEPPGKWCHWPTLVAYVGPGFLVCIAYLDPGNLEADLQVRMGMIGIPFGRVWWFYRLTLQWRRSQQQQ